IGRTVVDGVEIELLALEDFQRERVYGYPDDPRRFVRFSVAAAAHIGDRADIVHAHDWHTALLPVLARAGRLPVKTVLTIHNLAHQGLVSIAELARWADLPGSYFDSEGLEFYGQANLLKGGIVFADRVTTVSPTYAREILGSEHGEGLEGVLSRHRAKLSGICNGLDLTEWNPATDAHLIANYDVTNPAGKARCREALLGELGLREGPLVGSVGRVVPQKGYDLLVQALPMLVDLGVSIALLGTGDPALERSLRSAHERYPKRFHFTSDFNEPLAHRIYAGSDAFLMPSRFEPCGLAQMIAQRYGTPPIARATGGLLDTIEDPRTGFLFECAHAEGLVAGVARWLHRGQGSQEALMRACMQAPSSWADPSSEYLALYQALGD
ncbi:MAG: glycogen synthase, partial [Planctomycetota bacterium]